MEQNLSFPELQDAFSKDRLDKNLNSITVYNPDFKPKLMNRKNEGSYEVINDLGLDKTLIVNNLQLTSRYDRCAFAKFRCRNLKLDQIIIVFGFGLGDEVSYLSKVSSADIFVIILNPGLFYEIIGRLNKIDDLLKPNVHFVIPEESFPFSENSIINPVELYIEQSVYNNLKTKLINIIDDFYLKDFVDNTLAAEADSNLKANYEFLKTATLLREEDLVSFDKKIAIAAAGPSLQNNLETIKYLKRTQNITLITIDVALRYLLNKGIIPDVIVTCDSHISPEKLGDITEYKESLKKSLLIFCANTSRSLIDLFDCKKRVLFSQRQTMIFDYISKEDANFVRIAGSVLNLAAEIAIKSKPENILLFGTDFAFLDNQTHAGRSNSADLFRDIGTVTVKCNDGAVRNTVKPYTYYRYLLEQTISQNKEIRFDNYSKTGAVILGTNLVVD